MKAINYYIYLSFLLLCGVNHLYADTHHSPASFTFNQNLEKEQQVKHTNSNHGSLIIESADVDLDEEFHTSDEHDNFGSNKLLAVNHSLVDSWYLAFSDTFVFKDCSQNNKIFSPNCGYSEPIYLRIGVLRI